jgi:hypothetical protein
VTNSKDPIMPIRVKCDNCKKTLSVKDHLAGKKVKCPVCQIVVTVPASSAPKAPPASAAALKAAPAPTKPVVTAKPAIATKLPVDKTKSNGTPSAADKSKRNGVPAPPREPEPILLPPENIEEEAASAFADEPPPVEEDTPPKTIDFKCSWCDADLQLPIELAGKQTQCTNEECRRIVKVPLPKVEGKKDWRKMDRQGPAAARINQPEQLEDAWGTENTTKARQGSLAQAGALKEPPKPSVGVVGWLRRGFITCSVLLLGVLLIAGGYKLFTSKQQHNALEEAKRLVGPPDPKVTNPLLAAEVHRTIGLLFLQSNEREKAREARKHFQGAQSLFAVEPSDTNPAINEQLFLIELALSQIELGGDGDDILSKNKLEWEEVRKDLADTLRKIETPEVQVMGLREVISRLREKNQASVAISLAAGLGNAGIAERPPAFRQQIAVLYWKDDAVTQKNAPDLSAKAPVAIDPHVRVGYAEGYARKQEWEKALALAQLKGRTKDRMDACLGAAAVAWQSRHKEEAAKFVKEALSLVKEKDAKDQLSAWHLLELVKLAARTEEDETVKDLIKNLPEKFTPQFKLRAQMELFQVLCEKSAGRLDADKLLEIETDDQEMKTPEGKALETTPGTTLALGWMRLAQHNARNGASRDKNRKDFDNRAPVPHISAEMLRHMVDVGTFLGSMK